jgi:sortase (surface protein transpeptidase)
MVAARRVGPAMVLALAGTVLIGVGLAQRSPPPEPPPPAAGVVAAEPRAAPAPSLKGTSASHRPAPLSLPRSVPVRLDIPAIGVHTPLMSLGLLDDGSIAVPPLRRNAPAGWYRYLPTPGEAGPAVILGHVDSAHDGPAVFFRLGALRPGDQVTVTRADGSVAGFTVRSVIERAKTSFPGAAVYGPTSTPELRLITCGGRFERSSGSYRDNVIAFARLAWATPKRA